MYRYLAGILAFAGGIGIVGHVSAQCTNCDTTFDNDGGAGTHEWSVGAHWDNGVPAAGEKACHVNTSEYLDFDAGWGSPTICGLEVEGFSLGQTPPLGNLIISSGQLSIGTGGFHKLVSPSDDYKVHIKAGTILRNQLPRTYPKTHS